MPPPVARAGRALAAGALSLALLAAAGPGSARPVRLDDILNREGFGASQIDPTGHWLAFERRGPYRAAVRFDLDIQDDLGRTTLWRVDLKRPGAGRPLFRAAPGVAYALGPFSPDGARVVVYRLTPDNWELGVATLASGRVTWLGVTPERENDARTVQWDTAARLLVLARPDRDIPFNLRPVRNSGLLLPGRWRAAARGAAAVTVYGSGRYLDAHPQGPPVRLVQIDLPSRRRRTLATGRFMDLALAPDGRHAALLEAGGDIPMDARHEIQGAYGFENVFHRLRLLDRATGRLTTIAPGYDLLLHPLAWAGAGADLLVFARRDGEPWGAGHLYRVEAAAPGPEAPLRRADQGLTLRLDMRPEAARAGWFAGVPLAWGAPAGAAPDTPPAWFRLGPAGPVPVIDPAARPSREALAVAPGDRLLLAAGAKVWALDAQGRATVAAQDVEPLTYMQVNRLWTFDYDLPHAGRLAVRRRAAGGDLIVSVAPAGPATAGPAAGDPSAAAIAAPNAATVAQVPRGGDVLAVDADGALVRTYPAGGEERLLWVRRAGPPVAVAAINRALADLDAPEIRPVSHAGPHGERLTSWLILPPARAGAPPPPLIVRPYLGSSYPTPPRSADVRRSAGDNTSALLVAHGYAVLIPSLPARRDGAGPADGLADRVLAIVDAAAADPALAGRFDPARLGLWGESFGGYSTLVIVTQTDRFKAAIAQAATSDLLSEWGGFQTPRRVDPREGLSPFFSGGWVEDLQADMRAPPWADPDRYVRNSPAWHADRVRTPLLLLHGDQDTFGLTQPEEMFSGLLRQNKDAELAIYWGQGHVLGNPGNLRDLYRRAFAWFDTHLGPVTAPITAPATAAAPPPSRGRASASAARRPRPPRPTG
ncbi:S9 family peptidase [Phenylobacterium sp.]|jgi:dipeptidyl aminopeptidase/acylaminoacyl peptidase|uniref:S9 family peptidase n=1 Tax=Phenylobacterium sp. TaxID=1871053 RepID=UPI002F3E24CB